VQHISLGSIKGGIFMPVLIAHQLSYQLDTGEWLFQKIDFTLNDGLTGLVGRNGVGKSVLLSLLLGKTRQTLGSVTSQGKISFYSQLPSDLLAKDVRISDYLGITSKLLACRAILAGSCEQKEFDLIGDDWDIEQSTLHILKELGIEQNLDSFCHTLSGGQLALLQLHLLFESDAEILLLDEPSNHLDFKGKHWLIKQLKGFSGKVLLVSHDRALLNIMEGIYQLTGIGMSYCKGNYDAFLQQSTCQVAALDKQITQLKTEQKKIIRQGQINKEKAQQRQEQGVRLKKSGSQAKVIVNAMKDKAGQSQSTLVTSQQNQTRLNQEKLHDLAKHQEILKQQSLYLAQVDSLKNKRLLSIENLQLHYRAKQQINITLNQSDKCRLVGSNGCGKSSFLQVINNSHVNNLTEVRLNVKAVYLDQHFALLNLGKSIIDNLKKQNTGLSETEARTLLAGIGFKRDIVFRNVEHLSGGEKMKLSMLMVSYMEASPLLLLDEPDNHLDIESKQLLAASLNAYKGAFILVSHDEDFIGEVGINKCILME